MWYHLARHKTNQRSWSLSIVKKSYRTSACLPINRRHGFTTRCFSISISVLSGTPKPAGLLKNKRCCAPSSL